MQSPRGCFKVDRSHGVRISLERESTDLVDHPRHEYAAAEQPGLTVSDRRDSVCLLRQGQRLGRLWTPNPHTGLLGRFAACRRLLRTASALARMHCGTPRRGTLSVGSWQPSLTRLRMCFVSWLGPEQLEAAAGGARPLLRGRAWIKAQFT